MTGLLFLLLLGAFAAIFALTRRVAALEARVERLARTAVQPASETTEPPVVEAVAATAEDAIVEAPLDAPVMEPEIVPPVEPRFSLESLIGGRLPIWIGGAALVLAGIFLVRYSIESGLLGPAARTILAALFGLALIAASEGGRRLAATADDPRVAQVLAGAGVASLYATLYMAAALYQLVGALTGFALVVLVSAAAMALSLRHGPPTAVMALVGGFAAPLVAGFDAAGIGPLLVYLALFVAALFALAVHRGWGWLALVAGLAGFGWVSFLIAAIPDRPGDLAAVAGFAVLLAIGASLALPATGLGNRWLRVAPLVAGLAQLVALAPALDFGALAWAFYLVLSGAALVLAWRARVYLPGAVAAAALILAMEALALVQGERDATPLAALAAAMLFAVPGHLLGPRGRGWSAIALIGTAGPLLVAQACAPSLASATLWGLAELMAAAAAGSLAWRLRGAPGAELVAASAVAALLAATGLAQLFPSAWIAVPLSAVMLALAAWARHVRARGLFELPAYPFAAAIITFPLLFSALATMGFASLSGDRLPYLQIPALGELARGLLLPTAAALALLRDPRMFARTRRFVGVIAATLGILLAYALAKQALAIDTLARFAAWGFVERAMLTQACLGAAWGLMRRERLRSLAVALLALGLGRILWFDLLLLNPVVEAQAVGSVPLLNAAVAHAALAAFWLWTMPGGRGLRAIAAGLTIVAILAAVRQASHGSVLTGAIGTGENGGYSAGLLACALFWLWRGIAGEARDLRMLGLGLLTAVTLKVFLIDAAALDGVLRILSFLGLGLALIGIGWAYGRFLGRAQPSR